MPDLIPAAPGWYVEDTDEDGSSLDPVMAWMAGTDTHGDPTLFPFVDAGPGAPPLLLTNAGFTGLEFARRIVYRPNYDPAAETESS